ncbi:hypothetical protein [Ensifer sp. OV372]|uniref:hypothetical protein n=1 Tax=Ensifer sp. OV372 TaxID=1855293 RepID=UPI000B858DF0|nr:hypothetical protein [Ensifer sp. OV372]
MEAQTTAQNLVTTVLLWALNREATSVYDPVKEILRGIQADTASQLEANKKTPPTDLADSQVSYLLQSHQAIIDHIDKVLVKDGAKPPFNPTVIQGGKA